MKTHWIASAVACLLLVLFVSAGTSTPGVAQDDASIPEADEFEGKYVTVYVSDPLEGAGQILQDVELIRLGGRYMIAGTGADTGELDDWTAGVRVGIAWDSVTFYYVMTEKQFKEKLLEFE